MRAKLSTTQTFTDRRPSFGIIIFIILAESGLFFIAWLWAWFVQQDFWSLMSSGAPWLKQTGIGVITGLLSAAIIGSLVKRDYFSSVVDLFADISKEHGFKLKHWVIISFLAGICEEPLFRAMLQPSMSNWLNSAYAGLLLSSFLFIALHGYFSLSNSKMFIFGLCLFIISLMLGLLAMHIGMISAIVSHSVFDLFIIIILKKRIIS